MRENSLMIRVENVKKQYRLGQIGGGTLRGDLTPAAAAIAACTPVPGGIGSVTTALLLRHTVQAAKKSHHF